MRCVGDDVHFMYGNFKLLLFLVTELQNLKRVKMMTRTVILLMTCLKKRVKETVKSMYVSLFL
jgi:hypothetical protein